ncbi:MAG: c-type cytochrome [Pseudomonadota bacterium]|nr:c-type cytochrome [Pseudomonadota bacterium]
MAASLNSPVIIRLRVQMLGALAVAAAFVPCLASGQAAHRPELSGIGRPATPAEVKAWNIDVRGDFQGLPQGSGSVALGTKVWEAKCSSCHGDFGESNQVFTPIVGGTSKKDIEAGRVYFLANPGYPHRTTLMKVSKLSSVWDYINRAMPWNAPKSLSTDEVYGVLAYVLNLGDIVPADFTLSDQNIAEVQRRLPNRLGHVFYKPMWDTRGKGDVANPPCMIDCPVGGKVESSIPDAARNSNGNIADQVRSFGATRGTDTSAHATGPATTQSVAAAAVPGSVPAVSLDASALIKSNSCNSCHGMTNKIVGPAFQDVAKKYAGRFEAVDYLTAKIHKGGQGVWGPIPMPEQAQLSGADARAIAQWLVGGAK